MRARVHTGDEQRERAAGPARGTGMNHLVRRGGRIVSLPAVKD